MSRKRYTPNQTVYYRDNVGDLIKSIVTKAYENTLRVKPMAYAAEPHAGEYGLPERPIEARPETTVYIKNLEEGHVATNRFAEWDFPDANPSSSGKARNNRRLR